MDSSGAILKGYDPVGYFKQKRAVKGSPSITSTYHGASYYFGSKADKSEFEKKPSKYVPAVWRFLRQWSEEWEVNGCRSDNVLYRE